MTRRMQDQNVRFLTLKILPRVSLYSAASTITTVTIQHKRGLYIYITNRISLCLLYSMHAPVVLSMASIACHRVVGCLCGLTITCCKKKKKIAANQYIIVATKCHTASWHCPPCELYMNCSHLHYILHLDYVLNKMLTSQASWSMSMKPRGFRIIIEDTNIKIIWHWYLKYSALQQALFLPWGWLVEC